MMSYKLINCSQRSTHRASDSKNKIPKAKIRRLLSPARLLGSIVIALTVLAPFGSGMTASAQKVALKTNLLMDATTSPNAGVEIGLAPKWTLDVTGQFNLWSIDSHKWRHWLAQPEARYWFCQRFAGHFLGFHALGGQYNFGNLDLNFKFLGSDFRELRHNRYEGWGVGAGVAYGYAWPIARHWNIEAEIGIGWVYTKYDKYPCAECGTRLGSGHHNYFGPTKAAINLVYLF